MKNLQKDFPGEFCCIMFFMKNFMENFMKKKFFFLSFFAFFSAFLCVSCKSVEPSVLEAEKKLEEQEKFAAFTQKEYKSISLGEFSDGLTPK